MKAGGYWGKLSGAARFFVSVLNEGSYFAGISLNERCGEMEFVHPALALHPRMTGGE